MLRPLILLLLLCTTLAAGGCVGGESDDRGASSREPAVTPKQFAERFALITGVRLELVPGDPFFTRPDLTNQPDRHGRFGTFSVAWSGDGRIRENLLGRGAKPGADGIHWTRVGDRWSAAKAFGPRLIVQWSGEKTKKTTPKWDRLERAVRAAHLGRVDVLPAAEQPCSERGLDPLSGDAGECGVEGIPVTFADARGPLDTPALEARVLGVQTSDTIGEELDLPERAKGRFVEVAYRLRNPGDRPIRFLRLALRLGGRTYDPVPGASVLVPKSREFPIDPGESFQTIAVFDVAADLADRAREEGALVVPAATDELGDPAPDLAQGWIRLALAPDRLPKPPG